MQYVNEDECDMLTRALYIFQYGVQVPTGPFNDIFCYVVPLALDFCSKVYEHKYLMNITLTYTHERINVS